MYEHSPQSTQEQQQLQALQRVQQALAHGISHDLRAPLRVIDGFARQLRANESLDANAREHLQRIEGAGQRMAGLVDQLLEYLRAGSSELHPQEVDISLLADWSGAELCDMQPGREVSIDVAEGLTAWGDERQYKTLFDQLLGNAWRFSRADGSARIEVTGRRVDDWLHLQVRDHGNGFETAQAERVFEPFQRMHGENEGGGHGLGLSIAQVIVERAGGRIRAESAPGEGCTIHLQLPAVKPKTEADAVTA